MVLLATAAVTGLFVKSSVGHDHKTEKPDAAVQAAVTSTQPGSKEDAETRQGGEEVLPTLVLITTTQACKCTLERCRKAELTTSGIVKQFS